MIRSPSLRRDQTGYVLAPGPTPFPPSASLQVRRRSSEKEQGNGARHFGSSLKWRASYSIRPLVPPTRRKDRFGKKGTGRSVTIWHYAQYAYRICGRLMSSANTFAWQGSNTQLRRHLARLEYAITRPGCSTLFIVNMLLPGEVLNARYPPRVCHAANVSLGEVEIRSYLTYVT